MPWVAMSCLEQKTTTGQSPGDESDWDECNRDCLFNPLVAIGWSLKSISGGRFTQPGATHRDVRRAAGAATSV
jgi:hypothetical protein